MFGIGQLLLVYPMAWDSGGTLQNPPRTKIKAQREARLL
jgi:hypothetical protein